MNIPYFPFYANDWLDDENIFDMGLECEGAYIRLLAAMWKRDGYVPDKQNWCCNVLRCKPAKWKKIRANLIDLGVIKLENDRLFNERLIKELNIFNEKSKKNSENANKRWNKVDKKTPKKVNKNNGTNNATAQQSQSYTDTDTDTDTDRKEKGKKEVHIIKKSFSLPEWINKKSWAEFEQHRKEIKKGVFTNLAKTKAANQLKDFSFDQQQQIIDYSIRAGYPGLYTDKCDKQQFNQKNNFLTFDQKRQQANDQAAIDFANEIQREDANG